ncbi:MAG: TROVE domain-containing protein [Planctomycetes bacterium]|nr:TROVE domain-containing protein [Planctomycetota bacterium]
MANKSLFAGLKSIFTRAPVRNAAGGLAYALPPRHALAQIAVTGCFHGTFYADAEEQLNTLRALIAQENDNEFLAKLAIYSRERAGMKDMPAALVLALASRDTVLMHRVFDRVIDNGRLLRTLFQMIRAGAFGRNSLSSSLQRAFQRWLNTASVEKLLSASIGRDPSLRDILRLARPVPIDNTRRALFGWLTDKDQARWAPATAADLPEQVRDLIAFREAESADAQVAILSRLRARWDLLADAARGTATWTALARTMGPAALRMNLNTLARQGVFNDSQMVEYVANRLTDAKELHRARELPYQFLAAYLHVQEDIPQKIKAALQKAAELACKNVPKLPGPVVIGLDVSGSMQSPITGRRRAGATTKMRCVDVAALFAAAILRRNPDSVVIPFDTQAYAARLDPSDAILSLADRLARYGGGGTDCALPLAKANRDFRNRKFAGCVLISDNESWVYRDQDFGFGRNGSTGVLTEWQEFVKNQVRLQGSEFTGPRLVCIDLQPNTTAQAPDRTDILNIGGFSDAVVGVIAAFLGNDAQRFVTEIEAIELPAPQTAVQ